MHNSTRILVYFPKNGDPRNPPNPPPGPNPLKLVFWLFCWQLLKAQFWVGLKLLAVPKEPKPPPKFPKPPPNPPNCGRGAGAELVRLETTRTRRAAIMMRKSGD